MDTSNQNEETPKAKPNYKAILMLIVALAFMACFYTVVIRQFRQAAETKVSKPGIQAITKETGLRFPKSAHLLHSLETQMLSASDTFAEVEIKTSEVRSLIDSLPGKHVVDAGNGLKSAREIAGERSTSTAPSWWKPESAKQPTGVVIRTRDHDIGFVIGNDGPTDSIVYIRSLLL